MKNQYMGVALYIFQVVYIVFKGFYTRYVYPTQDARHHQDDITCLGSGISN